MDYTDFCEGTLRAALDTTTTTGVTLKLKQINGTYPTWPTTAHQLMMVQKTRTQTKVEKINVATGSSQTSEGVVTLGTLTRKISLTDGSDTSGTGTAQSFSLPTLVYITWTATDAEQTAKKNEANTFSAAQTIAAPLTVSGTTSYVKLPELTSTQRDALTAAEGMLIKNSTTNTVQQYTGGAWASVGTDATANGSTTVAGKFEEATVAEQGTSTATGGTGARLIPAVENLVKTSSGAGDENKIALLNASGIHANGFLATSGTPDSTTFLRGDRVWGSPSALYYRKAVFSSAADSATLTNPTSGTPYTVHTYTIPANFLTATTWVETEFNCIVTHGAAGTFGSGFRVAGSAVLGNVAPSTSGSTVCSFKGKIMGTAAAGASVAVRYEGTLVEGVTGGTAALSTAYATTNIATNGTLALDFYAIFGTSNGSNTTVAKMSTIWLCSTTPF